MKEQIFEVTAEADVTEVSAPDTPDVVDDKEALEATDITDCVTSSEEDALEENAAEDSEASLKAEIASLKEMVKELEAFRATQEQLLKEYEEFSLYFPNVSPSEIPESVWDDVKKCGSLIAAYALYEKKQYVKSEHIAKINSANAQRSPGNAGNTTANEYFTPDEVRKMSNADVHKNYVKIKESMKKWM